MRSNTLIQEFVSHAEKTMEQLRTVFMVSERNRSLAVKTIEKRVLTSDFLKNAEYCARMMGQSQYTTLSIWMWN